MKNNTEDPFDIDEVGDASGSNKEKGFEWEETLVDTGPFRPRTVKPLFNYKKFKWIYFLIVFIFLIILSRLFYLQVYMGDDLRVAAEENRYRIYTLSAPRGVIYDRKNNLLVRNVPAFDLVLTPADLNDNAGFENIWQGLSNLIELNQEEKNNILTNLDFESYEPVLIKENISREEALVLETNIDDFVGVKIEKVPIREYLYPDDFSHVLGYIGKINEKELKANEKQNLDYKLIDYIGKEGIEKKYEKDLRGISGKKQVEVDSVGNIKKVVAEEEPQSGNNLVLTIDKDLQAKSEEILQSWIKKAKAKKGVAISLNPKNGEILSIVSIPSYDNNVFSKGIDSEEYKKLIEDPDKPLYNRVISGIYPPASTIKSVMAAAGLQEGVINAETTIEDRGSIDVPNKYNPDIVYHFVGWERSGLGLMNVYSAVAKSSDIYFYYVGGGYEDFDGLGVEKIIEYYRKFGMGSKTGIDLPGEAEGLIPTPSWKEEVKQESWYLGDTYHISIGQGDLLTTPLQVLCWTAVFANGGELVKPYLLKDITSNTGDVIYSSQKKTVRKDFINNNYIDIVKRAMRETVLNGSGKSLSDLPFAAAGKTGTAQHGGSDKTHSWFTSFAPYEDPEIVTVVLVEEGGEGHDIAVPATKEILQWYFDNKE